MMSRHAYTLVTLLLFSGVCHAETEAGYIFIGFVASLPSLVFFLLMAWMMLKNREDVRVSLGILLVMLASIIPLGFNFTFYGAIYPNWVAYGLGFDYQVLPDFLLAGLMVLYLFILRSSSRGAKVPRSPVRR